MRNRVNAWNEKENPLKENGSKENPLVVVAGPTGSGKTRLAIAIAERWRGEIVSCDSVQVYRGLDIGSAKPTEAERRDVVHHLIDVAGPGDDFNAGDYSRLARTAIAAISERGNLPVVCGGTGLYLRALLSGLSPAPARSDGLRERLIRVAGRRPQSLHRLLANADEAAASRIHPNDHQKLVRALEMSRLEKKKVSEIQERPRDPLTGYEILKLGLNPDRDALYTVLNDRASAMFSDGLIAETGRLLKQGYSADSKPMQSLGYRQALQVHLQGASLAEAIRECQTRTRQYAKRQLTWFRADPEMIWFPGFGGDPQIWDQVREAVGRFLSGSPT